VRTRLPEYMVPAAMAVVEAIPLTPNGKVDRRALRAVDSLAEARPQIELPETPMEKLVERLWRDLLGVETIDVNDNFYDLGGHSLLALRFVAGFEEATGVRINVRELTYHTLGQLAAAHGEVVAVRSVSVLSKLFGRFGRRADASGVSDEPR